jgi:hypothetical protein
MSIGTIGRPDPATLTAVLEALYEQSVCPQEPHLPAAGVTGMRSGFNGLASKVRTALDEDWTGFPHSHLSFRRRWWFG